MTEVKNLKKKTALALVVMLLLTAAGSYILMRQGVHLVRERTEIRSVNKLAAADQLSALINEQMDDSVIILMEKGHNTVKIMTAALRQYLKDGEYTGPVCFKDGLVFTLKDGEPVFPDTVPEGFAPFGRDTFERALEDPYHYGSRVLKDVDIPEDVLAEMEFSDPTGYMSQFFLVFIDEIGDGYYYAGLNEGDEFFNYMQIYSSSETDGLIAATEEAFGGAVLVLDTSEPGLPFNFLSGYFGGPYYGEELGITPDDIQNRREVLTIQGEKYRCTYLTSKTIDNEVLIFARPYDESEQISTALQFMPVTLMMLLFFLTLTVYITASQKFVRERILHESLPARYRPAGLRLRSLALGAAGALLVFCTAGIMQAVSALHSETVAGAETIQILFDRLQAMEAEKAAAIRQKDEEWVIGYAERIAGLIREDPALAKREILQEFCGAVGADYIMVFDQDGKETACSRDYENFRLKTGKDDCWEDFSRLLLGIPSVIRDTEKDARTGLERQMIGVSLPLSVNGTDRHGALVMALYPDTIREGESGTVSFEQLKSLMVEGTQCFFADAENGDILYATDPSFAGGNIAEFGLAPDTLRNGYMDFALINGVRCYVVTSKASDCVIYSLTDTGVLFRHSLSYGLLAAAVFLAVFLVLCGILMSGYTERSLRDSARAGAPPEAEAPSGPDPGQWGSGSFLLSVWNSKSPEGKAGLAFRWLSCLTILLYLGLSRLAERAGGADLSLFSYIMQGGWMRGINLFGICASAIVLITGFVLLTLCGGAVSLLCRVLDSKGETICRLVYNLIQYLTVFVLLYQVFSYMGFPTSTVLASVGLVSLAITFGAQGLVADILAGVFNVLEGGFRVGDIIQTGGFEGVVRDIGVRTTVIESGDQDVKIIENSQIGDVINKTRLTSFVVAELVLSASESLERVEAILETALPDIGRRMDKIISGPVYRGVFEMNGSYPNVKQPAMMLHIEAECRHADVYAVRCYLNREIVLLCEREHIHRL